MPVTACHSGKAGMRSVSSGTTMVSPGRIATWPLRQVGAAVREDTVVPAQLANRGWLGHGLHDSDVVVASYHELVASGLTDLHGKAVITSAVTDEQLADLAARDVDLVVDTTPQPYDVTVDVASLEAMMHATVRAPGGAPERLRDDDLLEMILADGLQPRLLQPNGPRRKWTWPRSNSNASRGFPRSRVRPPSTTSPRPRFVRPERPRPRPRPWSSPPA